MYGFLLGLRGGLLVPEYNFVDLDAMLCGMEVNALAKMKVIYSLVVSSFANYGHEILCFTFICVDANLLTD